MKTDEDHHDDSDGHECEYEDESNDLRCLNCLEAMPYGQERPPGINVKVVQPHTSELGV